MGVFVSTVRDLLEGQSAPKPVGLFIAGDGAGLKWDDPGGWASIMYEPLTGIVKMFIGSCNRMSVNTAELMPYLHAVRYHWFQIMDQKLTEVVNVCIFSDSEFTVKCGRRINSRNCNGDLWAAFDFYETKGYRFHWYFVHRNSNPIHALMDQISKSARILFKEKICTVWPDGMVFPERVIPEGGADDAEG